jgi:hypothetical protein
MATHYRQLNATPATNNQILQLTGTASIASTTAITGSGTAFTTQLRVGSWVKINNEVRRIASITSDTVATSDIAFSSTDTGKIIYSSGRSKNRSGVLVVKADATNTGTVSFGESFIGTTTPQFDGSDVTTTNGSYTLSAGESSAPIVVEDILNIYAQGSVASQKINITTNF